MYDLEKTHLKGINLTSNLEYWKRIDSENAHSRLKNHIYTRFTSAKFIAHVFQKNGFAGVNELLDNPVTDQVIISNPEIYKADKNKIQQDY